MIVWCPLSTIASKDNSDANAGWILTKLAIMILIWPNLIIIQKVSVHCITRSNELKIDFLNENFKNVLA